MIEIKVRPATHEDTFSEGDQIYYARGRTGGFGTVIVEPITITGVREQSNTRRGPDGPISYSYKHADWRSATGTTSGFTFGSTDESCVPNFKTNLLVPDENGETVLCYERVGTAVTVTVLVDELDHAAAAAKVMEALAPVASSSDEPHPRDAYDRSEHYFEMDGQLVAESVPHWSHGRLGLIHGHSAEGCMPAHQAQYEIMKSRVERETERATAASRRRGRPPGSKNKVKKT